MAATGVCAPRVFPHVRMRRSCRAALSRPTGKHSRCRSSKDVHAETRRTRSRCEAAQSARRDFRRDRGCNLFPSYRVRHSLRRLSADIEKRTPADRRSISALRVSLSPRESFAGTIETLSREPTPRAKPLAGGEAFAVIRKFPGKPCFVRVQGLSRNAAPMTRP